MRIVGVVDYWRSAEFLAGCDVAVAPYSDMERMRLTGASPLKLLMYLACELPTVVSDLPSLAWLKASGACLFAAANDPRALAERMVEVLRLSDETRRAMGRRGREFVRKRHAWDEIAGQILRIVRRRGIGAGTATPRG